MRILRSHTIKFGQPVPQEGQYWNRTDCLIIVQLDPLGSTCRFLFADRNGRVVSDKATIDKLRQDVDRKINIKFNNLNELDLNNIKLKLELHKLAPMDGTGVETYKVNWLGRLGVYQMFADFRNTSEDRYAYKNASNITNLNVLAWKEKLGINQKADINGNNVAPYASQWREKLGITATPNFEVDYVKKDLSNMSGNQLSSWRATLDINNRALKNAGNVVGHRMQWKTALKFIDNYTAEEIGGTKYFLNSVHVRGFDLTLGAGNQTDRGDSGVSRALVKTNGGSGKAMLTINYGGDFTAGTRIQSLLYVTDDTHVTGNIAATGNMTASAFFESSLEKYKTNIKDFKQNALDLVNNIKIKTFDKIDGPKDKIGIMADNSPKEFLSEERDAVDLYKTVFVLAKAVQELSAKVEDLEKLLK